ncbi:MAG TPA: MBOAT family O-acyltransferase [Kofleriaceae bacterium]|nr:MBOAT family O-acyltransferase [Kofleriaceae bacterium]
MYFLDARFLALAPLVLVVYWLSGSARNHVLLAASVGWLCVFSPSTLLALSGMSLGVVLPVARAAARAREAGRPGRAGAIGWLGIAALLAIAIALRLPSYFLPDRALSATLLGDPILHWIGFSYFLLKCIHVMRGSARGIVAAPGALQLLHYVLFVPTLTSGPIYRLDTFVTQLEAPRQLSWDGVHDGLVRCLIGIAKKVVLVPTLAAIVSPLSARGLAGKPLAFAALYVLLYFDFSGYTDVAIGLGRLLGFQVPENFKKPFTSTTLTQFWRNWHATLGDWIRENVFIPLGGLRAEGAKLSAIVLGSMLLVGLWHRFTLVFIGWGAYHGALLLLENWLGVKPLRPYRTPWWQLWLRYALIQAAAAGGMFAFMDWVS